MMDVWGWVRMSPPCMNTRPPPYTHHSTHRAWGEGVDGWTAHTQDTTGTVGPATMCTMNHSPRSSPGQVWSELSIMDAPDPVACQPHTTFHSLMPMACRLYCVPSGLIPMWGSGHYIQIIVYIHQSVKVE